MAFQVTTVGSAAAYQSSIDNYNSWQTQSTNVHGALIAFAIILPYLVLLLPFFRNKAKPQWEWLPRTLWQGVTITSTLLTLAEACLLYWLAYLLESAGNSAVAIIFNVVALGTVCVALLFMLDWSTKIGEVEKGKGDMCGLITRAKSLMVSLRTADWYRNLFAKDGKYFLAKEAISELVQIILQLVSLNGLTAHTDSFTMFGLIAIISAHCIVSPCLFFIKPKDTKDKDLARRNAVVQFNTLMALCYFGFEVSQFNNFTAPSASQLLGLLYPVISLTWKLHAIWSFELERALAERVRKASMSQSSGVNTGMASLPPDAMEMQSRSSEAREGSSSTADTPTAIVTSDQPRLTDSTRDFEPEKEQSCLLTLLKIIAALCVILFGVGLLLAYTALVVRQNASCQSQVGAAIWSRAHPKIFFPMGMFAPPDCNFGLYTSLDLSNLGLTSLPPSISLFSSVTTLNANNNQLTSLPLSMDTMALTELDLRGNPVATSLSWAGLGLSTLPKVTYLIPTLVTLNLSSNAFTALPSISTFSALLTLDLS